MANLKTRLIKLESRNTTTTPLCIIYSEDDGLTPEQQSQVDAADAVKAPVLLICINNAENFCHE